MSRNAKERTKNVSINNIFFLQPTELNLYVSHRHCAFHHATGSQHKTHSLHARILRSTCLASIQASKVSKYCKGGEI